MVVVPATEAHRLSMAAGPGRWPEARTACGEDGYACIRQSRFRELLPICVYMTAEEHRKGTVHPSGDGNRL